MEPAALYDKANSIVEVRGRQSDRIAVLERIRRCQDALPAAADHTMSIVRLACGQLLGDAAAGDRPRFQLRDHVLEELERVPDDSLPRYLFYRYRYEIFPPTQQLDDFPPCLQIEPSSICNYRCVFCYQTDREFTTPRHGHMGLMSLDLFRRVIDEAEGRCEAVTLASRGEPLLCDEIEAMLAYTRGKFLALKVNTNAWFLDERLSHALLQSGASTVVFSADAAAEPLYSQLRVRGKLDRVMANIERFQNIRVTEYPRLPVITRVSGVRYGEGQDLSEMEAVWGALVDQVAFVAYNPWENTYKRPPSEVTAPCSDLWRRTFVWFDGTVNPCDVDYLSTLAVGNVREASLAAIWTGPRYAALRAAHSARRRAALSPCNRCTLV